MNKNTGCGCNSHDKCPPLPTCDTAKTQDHFCMVGTPINLQDFERNVIIADIPITTNVEADIRLPHSAREIKQIRKNVQLTQCKAIPIENPNHPGAGIANAVNLFIEGFVHKNIQFSDSCNGFIRDFSVNVPFKCFQTISNLPDIDFCFSQKNNQISEIREMAADGMGSDRCSFGSETFEVFNQPVKCKLLRAKVLQMDFPHDFDNFGNFNKLTEKVTIDLVVRLTQEQRRDNAGANLRGTCF